MNPMAKGVRITMYTDHEGRWAIGWYSSKSGLSRRLACLTFRATPTTVSHGLVLSRSVLIRLPIGSTPGQYCWATVSSTTTTSGERSSSLGRNPRPLMIGVPMASKYPGVAPRTLMTGPSVKPVVIAEGLARPSDYPDSYGRNDGVANDSCVTDVSDTQKQRHQGDQCEDGSDVTMRVRDRGDEDFGNENTCDEFDPVLVPDLAEN